MSDCARRCRNFAPCLGDEPLNETARLGIVSSITAKHPRRLNQILYQTANLMLDRVPRPEEVSLYMAAGFHDERRIRFMPEIVIGQKIRKQLAVFKNRVDRLAQKSGVTAERPHRITVCMPIWSNLKIFCLSGFHLPD